MWWLLNPSASRTRLFAPEGNEPSGGGPVDPDGIPFNVNPTETFAPDLGGGWENMSEPKEAVPEGKPPGPETAPPTPETTTEEPKEEAAPAEEPSEERPAEEAVPDSPDTAAQATEEPEKEGKPEVPTALQNILEKYNYDPAKVGSAYQHLQGLQTAQARELGEARKLIDENFTVTDGKLGLRPEVRERILKEAQQQNGQGQPAAPGEINEATIRAEITSQFLEQLGKSYDVDDPEAAVKNFQPMIDEQVEAKVKSLRSMELAHQLSLMTQATGKIDTFFAEHPDAKEFHESMNDWYAGFPDEMRSRILDYLPLDRVYEAEKLRRSIPGIIQETWDLAMEQKAEAVTPTDGGKPAGGSSASRTMAQPKDPDVEFKESLLGNPLPGIESLFGSAK
jgi:hypothetical protein